VTYDREQCSVVGRTREALEYQRKSVDLGLILYRYAPYLPTTLKAVLKLLGLDLGPCRLPLETLNTQSMQKLRDDLKRQGLCQV
jgi:N-acetylneuraminate lyase